MGLVYGICHAKFLESNDELNRYSHQLNRKRTVSKEKDKKKNYGL